MRSVQVKFIVGIIALLASYSASQAADMLVKKAPPPPVQVSKPYNWTGFYAGLNGTYHDGRITVNCPPPNFCGSTPHKLTGTYLAFQGGYDYEFANNIVVGLLAQVPLTRFESGYPFGGANFLTQPRSAYGGAVRVGYAFDRLLPYAAVGYQHSHVRTISPISPISVVENNHDGPVYGGGLEYAVLDNVSVYAQYFYGHMKQQPYNYGGGFEAYGENSNSVSAGINVRFNGFK